MGASTANGSLPPVEAGTGDPAGQSERVDVKKRRKKGKEEEGPVVFDAKVGEARLNDVEKGSRDDSGRWWLRKPKPREAREGAASRESRTRVWAEPVFLRQVNVLAMPYVIYL